MEICINCINDNLGICSLEVLPITNEYGEGLGCASFLDKDKKFYCHENCKDCFKNYKECTAPWKLHEYEF